MPGKLEPYQFGTIIVNYVGRVSFLTRNAYGTLKALGEITRVTAIKKGNEGEKRIGERYLRDMVASTFPGKRVDGGVVQVDVHFPITAVLVATR